MAEDTSARPLALRYAERYSASQSRITHATLTHATRILIYSTYKLSIQAHPPRPDAVAIPEKSKERKQSAHTLAGTIKQKCHNYPHAPYATLRYANMHDLRKHAWCILEKRTYYSSIR